ncbi:group 1 glycosyl transferase [Flavobacterium limnosediminis JC2902]|uniref:Group 1 glycosyl transferase n=2 Tax=Flavobacterium TaxID=237 RepID=V6SI52_9FLAO|nr:group 1 glycosyl transferase [Flavobacterium limnosediminis JC2902]
MDHFYWLFDKECKQMGYEVIWFFPNESDHGEYNNLTIISAEDQSIEALFLKYITNTKIVFDVVITHFLELCTPFFKKIKTNFTCKVIAVDHNARPLNGYPLKKTVLKRIKGFLFSKHIDVFVAVSKYTTNLLVDDFGKQIKTKTVLVYNGINTGLFEKRTFRNFVHPTFLVASNLGYPKGIQDLIEAVSKLPENCMCKLKIDVYGTGNYEKQLEELVRKYNLEETFSFKGSRSNLFEIYNQYDYLLQPTHMECFSLSVLESLSANVPVITTSVGGNEEVIKNGENGFIFPPQDINRLSEILESVFIGKLRIIQDTSVLIEEQFSIQKMVKEHIALL